VFIFSRIWDESYSFGLQQFVDAGAKVWHSGDHKELLWIINDCSVDIFVTYVMKSIPQLHMFMERVKFENPQAIFIKDALEQLLFTIVFIMVSDRIRQLGR
jgi:hypothetical protein